MADCNDNNEETNSPTSLNNMNNSPKPPIIMKVSAPEESSENSANDEADTDGNSTEGSSKSDSSTKPTLKCPILAQSKFGNSFGINSFSKSLGSTSSSSSLSSTSSTSLLSSSILKPTILRPSQLNSLSGSNSSKPSDTVESSKASNPFLKVSDKAIIDDEKEIDTPKTNDQEKLEKPGESSNDKEQKQSVNYVVAAPKFLPLQTNPKENINNDGNVNNAVAPNSAAPSFVFGQNLKDRVTVAQNDEEKSKDSDDSAESKSEEPVTENGNSSSELLFSAAATTTASRTSTPSRPGLTLTQAAQEVEEANRANKRKYSQVTLLTGEEDETNVLQINCKLFAFDKETSGWKERGRGILRLNDKDEESRIVGRATGTQRLILNTKIWPGMSAERAGPKSLRLTAMDVGGDIRIFIIQAAPTEIDQLHFNLIQRLKRAKERFPKKLATDQ